MTLEEAKKRIRESLKRSRKDLDKYCDEGCRGEIAAYKNVLSILKQVDSEQVHKDKMTLTELAHEMRKIFWFKYLAAGEMFYWGRSHTVVFMSNEPLTLSVSDEGGEGCPCFIHEWEGEDIIDVFSESDLVCSLDLSEYKDENGEIDYSKCIVEVE